MDNNPLFSVLVANYNNGKYLIEAIESVNAQTYTNWEIILVDDCSTDNSHELYKELEQDNRIHIFYNKKNCGCGYTKRRCVELAHGDICGFLDADDVLIPGAIQTHVNMHLRHTEVSCVMSRFYKCDEQLNIIGELRRLQIPNNETYFIHRDYAPEHLASFKKQAYQLTVGISPVIKAAVDQDLYFKLEEVSPVLPIDDLTYKYRITNNSLSHSGYSQWADYWNMIVRHETCLRRGLDFKEYSYKDFCSVLNLYKDLGMEDARSQIRKTKSYRLGHALLHPFDCIKRLCINSR